MAQVEAPGVAEAKQALTLISDKMLCELMDDHNHLMDEAKERGEQVEFARVLLYYRLSLAECGRRALVTR